jgi:hypothetical protein
LRSLDDDKDAAIVEGEDRSDLPFEPLRLPLELAPGLLGPPDWDEPLDIVSSESVPSNDELLCTPGSGGTYEGAARKPFFRDSDMPEDEGVAFEDEKRPLAFGAEATLRINLGNARPLEARGWLGGVTLKDVWEGIAVLALLSCV